MSTFHWLGPVKKEELNLPKDYPNADINLAGYNSGFEESQSVVTGTNASFICTICFEIPKRPIILPGCGHLFCQACIERNSHSKMLKFSEKNLRPISVLIAMGGFAKRTQRNSRHKTRGPNECSSPFN